MNKKKILHVANLVGGVEVCIRQIINNIDHSKIISLVASQPLNGKEKILNSDQKEVKVLKIPIQREINLFRDIVCFFKLLRIIKTENPDLIHAHSAKAGVLCRVASKFIDIQVFYTPHAFSFLSAQNKLLKKLYLNIERLTISKRTLIVATSESEMKLAINEVGYKAKNTFVLKNAIKIETISKSRSEITKGIENYICTVARPSFQKNLEMLIDVFKIVSKNDQNLHLFILGAGEYSPQKDHIKKLITKEGLNKRATITPWISRNEVQKILMHSKLYVSTSRYEGLPYSVLESMRFRVPAVLTNCFGNKDLIVENKTGFLVKLNQTNIMAKKILELTSDQVKREKFGHCAYELLNKRHNFEEYIETLTNLYSKLSKN